MEAKITNTNAKPIQLLPERIEKENVKPTHKKKGKGKLGHKIMSKSKRVGLMFPVGRVSRYLRKGKFSPRVGGGAGIFLTAVLEYLACEVLELSGNASKDNKKTRIAPRHIQLAVRNDMELAKLLNTTTISNGGVLPNIHEKLLPLKKNQKVKKETNS